MKANITEERFCELVDSIKNYWSYLNKIEEALGISILEGPAIDIVGDVTDFLVNAIYGEPMVFDNITYFMWELDFGENWEPGMVLGENGEDIPLRNAHDLWNLLQKECS